LPFFETGFLQPAQGRISGVFGSQRILNGQPRSPHSGLDIAAPTGTPIVATADGIVSLVHDGMVLTGKTVMIDHGFGLDSVYIHMSDISVEQGQRVRQGDPIGAIGMTGRTNGPHLHFGISWYGAKLDPQTVMAALPAGQNILQ
jgi:murein DD-endopeptidase MepM/ murein hydrolase activator NlpD